jgi:hypothetical protein
MNLYFLEGCWVDNDQPVFQFFVAAETPQAACELWYVDHDEPWTITVLAEVCLPLPPIPGAVQQRPCEITWRPDDAPPEPSENRD